MELPREYIVLRQALFFVGDDSYEVDHLVLSPYGLFVIETKGHQGLIVGDMKTSEWIQYLGKQSFRLYSPIYQNRSKVRMLEQLLGSAPFVPIIPLVVFVYAKISDEKLRSEVLGLGEVLEVLRRHQTPYLTGAQQAELLALLSRHLRFDEESHKKHLCKVYLKRRAIASRLYAYRCPICTQPLVKRLRGSQTIYTCSSDTCPNCHIYVTDEEHRARYIST